MFIHDFDIMFTVHSDNENPDNIPPAELRRALQKRLDKLQDDELHEACGHVGSMELDNDD